MSVILIVLLLIIVFAFFSGKRVLSVKWITGKKIFWLFGAYVLILLVSTVHYLFFLPEVLSSEGQINSEEVVNAAGDLQWKAENGDFDDMEKDYRRNVWTIEPETKELNIDNTTNHVSVYYIQGDYPAVKAAYYQSPSIVNGDVVTAGYQPEVELNNHVLSIQEDTRVVNEKQYAGYKKEFPFQQFDISEKEPPSAFTLGFGTIVIKIPDDIEIRAKGAVPAESKEE